MSKMAGEMATLTKTVNSQTTTIAHLLQSHEKQSKLAIRKLLDDAENLPDKSRPGFGQARVPVFHAVEEYLQSLAPGLRVRRPWLRSRPGSVEAPPATGDSALSIAPAAARARIRDCVSVIVRAH
eukprot:gene7612-5471_t